MADGDGRALLNLIEQVMAWKVDGTLDRDALSTRLMRRAAHYDKSGDEHYNLISALHKSVRGSDPDAALYWFARMLAGRRGPALSRPPADPDGGGGYRPGRSAGQRRLPAMPGRPTSGWAAPRASWRWRRR